MSAGAAGGQGPAPLPAAVASPASATGWKNWPAEPTPARQPVLHFANPVQPVGGRVQNPAPQTPSPQTADPKTQPPVDKNPAQLPPISVEEEPAKDLVFRLDKDEVLGARIRARIDRKDLQLQSLPDLAGGKPYVARAYPPSKVEIEPGYVVHRRLLFEEKNAERHGWELGAAQPIVSTAYFYRDCLFLPYKVASNIHECYDTSAGKCLPGSPVPYYLYPPDFSWTGTAAELGVVTGLVLIFP